MSMAVHSVRELFAGRVPTGTEVTVQGWVRTRRDSKAGVSFVDLGDGSCLSPLQVVAPRELPNYATEVAHVSSGCALEVTGALMPSQGKGQKIELVANTVRVVGWVVDPDKYPIQPKAHSLDFLREVAHLRPRTNTFTAVTRLRHALSRAIHRFFDQEGFYWVHTPIVTASDCEGGGALFRVSTLDLANLPRTAEGRIDFSRDFFGRETFLTVSGQLELETYCMALSRVYTFGPTFRAENSNTTRHLAEFWMVEPELAFADLSQDADLAERFLKFILRAVLDECPDELRLFRERIDPQCIERLEHFVEASFERLDYAQVIRMLEAKRDRAKFEFPVQFGLDLQSEHEQYLTEKLVGRPVVVMNYPREIKAFYMRQNDDGRTVAAMDVLAPGIGEIIGGAQREERLDVLSRRMQELGMSPDTYWWYLDLRRYGTVPHAGFGLGLERMLIYITGLGNIRDVIPFPRAPGSAEF
jgi:asparaginyl-tRNA synthetase